MMVSRRTYAGRALGFARRQVAGIGQRLKDQRYKSYTHDSLKDASLCSFFRPLSSRLLAAHQTRLAGLTSNYLAHRFDLLGSGWVQVRHAMDCSGLEGSRYQMGAAVIPDRDGRWLAGRINRANLAESQRIWRLVDPDYTPIDWQLDFKSGFRWSESTWYLDCRYGHKPGVDIKVPWELARMQHLPQLAAAYALARSEARDAAATDRYAAEFRNQVLDFIATNPPRFGVNWRSAMEAAIRAANWAVAADLFRAAGAVFDPPFNCMLARSLLEHGLHVAENLEWDPQVRGNHYLANITGLLFIAGYLPRSSKTDAWLALAVRELIAEADFQFAPDGSHREASTGYHRLCAEMMTYATALVLALPQDRRETLPLFPGWYFERMVRMGEFVADITKPDGHVPQVGDNDSGRFLRFDGPYTQMTYASAKARYENLSGSAGLPDNAPYWDEDHLDHRGLVAAMGALLGRDDLLGVAGEGWLEADIVRALSDAGTSSFHRQPLLAFDPTENRTASADCGDQLRALREQVDARPGVVSYEIPAPASGDLRAGITCHSYPDFGLYILRSQRLYLAIRCGAFGLVGNGAHAHHDQLSIELSLDGRNLILDPGTYLYSPLKNRRDEYRQASAHFSPQIEGRVAQGTGPGLFQMRDQAHAQCLHFGAQGFAGCHRAYGTAVYRVIEIDAGAIRITDGVEGKARLRKLTPDCGWRCGWRESPRHSPGYGVVLRDLEPISR